MRTFKSVNEDFTLVTVESRLQLLSLFFFSILSSKVNEAYCTCKGVGWGVEGSRLEA